MVCARKNILIRPKEFADFALDIRPTYDFQVQLLHYAAGLEVLEPANLRQQMKEEIIAMANNYKINFLSGVPTFGTDTANFCFRKIKHIKMMEIGYINFSNEEIKS